MFGKLKDAALAAKLAVLSMMGAGDVSRIVPKRSTADAPILVRARPRGTPPAYGQGDRECARRRRQIASGMLKAENRGVL